ncbi:MAG: lipopolysaccharide biosynthesis protein [Clostridia bacterium]
MANKTVSSLAWKFAEKCGAQGITFIVSIVLARILAPELYGTIALVNVFIVILNVFIDSGLGTALVQKKDADNKDFSTVFFFNFAMCLVIYSIMFFIAPLVANFYDNTELTAVIRVLSLTLVISGVKGIQQAYVSKNMLFKKFFFSTLGGTITAAVVGITMAYMGFGVWALVAQSLANNLIDTIILWFTVKWRPMKYFSFNRFKYLFSYGWKLLVSALLDTGYSNLTSLIIGKMYSSTDLAYYNKGNQFPNIIVGNINSSIDSVLFPTMSKNQEDRPKIKSMTRRAIKTSTYIMAPLMIGLAVTAESVVRLLLTDKWVGCVPFMQIFCITYLFYPIHTANLNAIKAMGRSDLFLKLEIIKKVTGLAILLSVMWFGVMAMAYSLLLSSVISQIINSYPNKKLINYNYIEQLKDIMPNILMAVFMGACVYMLNFLSLPVYLILAMQIIVGAVIYILGSMLFKLEAFNYILGIVKGFRNK